MGLPAEVAIWNGIERHGVSRLSDLTRRRRLAQALWAVVGVEKMTMWH